MTQPDMSHSDTQPGTAPSSIDRDRLTRFLIHGAGVRGVLVHLHDSWQQIRERMGDASSQAPAAIELLGEAAAATALFTGHAKVDGRLSIQLRGTGPLRTLFAECTAAGTLRGIAQLDGTAAGTVSRDLRELGDDAVLAITIENPAHGTREPMRYQGLVALESDSLSGAFEDYFRQSEQLPTRLLLATDGDRAAGLMLQKLPGDEGDEDGWLRAGALFDKDGVQVVGEKPLRFGCSCSRERVESMLVSLGEEEALAAVADGEADIRCEFCGEHYRFSPEQVTGLLALATSGLEAPDRVQ